MIEFVEQEVTKIKQGQEEAERQMAMEKEDTIQSLSIQVEQYARQIEIKNDEIKILLDKMDQYKKHKDDQVNKLKDKLQRAEGDIKAMVAEHEL